MCTVRNFLRVWLTVFLHFGFVYALDCLPYFFQLFCAFLRSFLLSKCSHLQFCCFAGSWLCHFLDLSDFLSTHFVFFCAQHLTWSFTLGGTICFAFLQLVLLIVLSRFVCCFFCLKKHRLHVFCLLVLLLFVFLLANLCRIYLVNISALPKHPLLCCYCALIFFLTPVFFVADFLLLSFLDQALQNMSCSPICGPFCLVFAFMIDYASMLTHPNRFTPILTHPWSFLTATTKHDVRGNFPGHRYQIMSCTTVFVSACLVFVPSRGPCVPMHPCAPIRTHFQLFSPV